MNEQNELPAVATRARSIFCIIDPAGCRFVPFPEGKTRGHETQPRCDGQSCDWDTSVLDNRSHFSIANNRATRLYESHLNSCRTVPGVCVADQKRSGNSKCLNSPALSVTR